MFGNRNYIGVNYPLMVLRMLILSVEKKKNSMEREEDILKYLMDVSRREKKRRYRDNRRIHRKSREMCKKEERIILDLPMIL